jgi:hypothetical protein
LPLACFGHETFWQNARRLRRTDFHINVGHPFHLEAPEDGTSRQIRQEMTDEVMYQVASLLPEQNRGEYADLSKATERFLRFAPGATSNVSLALA